MAKGRGGEVDPLDGYGGVRPIEIEPEEPERPSSNTNGRERLQAMVDDAGAQFVGTDVPLGERLAFIRESFERQVPPERQTLEVPDGQRAQYEEELAFAREQGRKLGGDPMPAIRVKRKWTAKLEAQQARQQQNHDWLYGDNNTNESDDPWSSIVGEDYTDDDDGLMD